MLSMTIAELKVEIQKAVQSADDTHLLEVVLALLNINAKPEAFDMYQKFTMGRDRKTTFVEGQPRNEMVSAIKKKILENLEK